LYTADGENVGGADAACSLVPLLIQDVMCSQEKIMWNAPTKIFDDGIAFDIEKKEKAYQLVSEFEISNIGVAIVFDSEDYLDFPNEIWRSQGVHLNIKEGGIEDFSPNKLYDIMDSCEYSNLIWISNRICVGDIIQFVWVVSHEFQHYVQNSTGNIISVSNHFLYECFRDRRMVIDEPREESTIPHEFDAEITALKMVQKIFGINSAKKYIQNSKNRSRLEKLSNFDNYQGDDVISNTVHFLTKYRSRLIEFKKLTEDSFVKEFDIDKSIEELNNCYKAS